MKRYKIIIFCFLNSALIVHSYQQGKENKQCNCPSIEKIPDYTGNIQGDTICKT